MAQGWRPGRDQDPTATAGGARAMTPRGLFGVGAAIAMLTLIGLFLGLLRDGYNRAEAHAEATTLRAAQSAAAELARTVQAVDALLFDLAAPDAPTDPAALRQRLRDLPLVRDLVRDLVRLGPTLHVRSSTDAAFDRSPLWWRQA